MIVCQKICRNCAQRTAFEKDEPKHLLHVILCLFTVGLWIPIWIMAILFSAMTRCRCRVCGGTRTA